MKNCPNIVHLERRPHNSNPHNIAGV